METLLQTYSGTQIILFVFLLAIAFKEVLELIKYYKKEGLSFLTKEKKNEEQDLQIAKNSEKLDEILDKLELLQDKVCQLEQSDKDGIKAWIVYRYREIQKHPEQLDSMGMDLLERRFQHYKKEGGNSYIEELMENIRDIYKKNGESN